jgi:hypothetical protein
MASIASAAGLPGTLPMSNEVVADYMQAFRTFLEVSEFDFQTGTAAAP